MKSSIPPVVQCIATLLTLILLPAPSGATEEQSLEDALEKQPDKVSNERPPGWSNALIVSLGFSQNTFSNWEAGGTSSMAWIGGLSGDFDYVHERHAWINDLVFEYGVSKQEGQELRKSVDSIGYETVYVRLFNYFVEPYAAAGFTTQLALGRDYGAEPGGDPSRNESFPATSKFADPLYMSQSIGVGRQALQHLTTRLGFAVMQIRTDEFRRYGCTKEQRETIDDASVRDQVCDSFRVRSGLEWVSKYNRTFQKRTKLKSTLRFFYNFEEPGQVDFSWRTGLTSEILKYITFDFALDFLLLKDVRPELQIQQLMAIGVNFSVL